MKVGEEYRFEIEWQSVGARKSHDMGSIVPALAKNARTGHPPDRQLLRPGIKEQIASLRQQGRAEISAAR